MAALIKCFDGYGFHGGSHGTSSYADALIADAAKLEAEELAPPKTEEALRKKVIEEVKRLLGR